MVDVGDDARCRRTARRRRARAPTPASGAGRRGWSARRPASPGRAAARRRPPRRARALPAHAATGRGVARQRRRRRRSPQPRAPAESSASDLRLSQSFRRGQAGKRRRAATAAGGRSAASMRGVWSARSTVWRGQQPPPQAIITVTGGPLTAASVQKLAASSRLQKQAPRFPVSQNMQNCVRHKDCKVSRVRRRALCRMPG